MPTKLPRRVSSFELVPPTDAEAKEIEEVTGQDAEMLLIKELASCVEVLVNGRPITRDDVDAICTGANNQRNHKVWRYLREQGLTTD